MTHRRLAVILMLLFGALASGCQKRDEAMLTLRVYDLLAAFPRATVTAPASSYVLQGDFSVGRETLPSLFVHPPSSVQFPPVRASAESVLTFRYGVRDEAWDKAGDGVDFTVYVQGTGPSVKLLSRYVDPKHNPADRHWIDGRVPLRPFAGQEIRITFTTGPGPAGDTTNDWAVWGEPRIILTTRSPRFSFLW